MGKSCKKRAEEFLADYGGIHGDSVLIDRAKARLTEILSRYMMKVRSLASDVKSLLATNAKLRREIDQLRQQPERKPVRYAAKNGREFGGFMIDGNIYIRVESEGSNNAVTTVTVGGVPFVEPVTTIN